ncbi:MAG: glycoside hydrolase family 26 protein [Haloplanus sp.]
MSTTDPPRTLGVFPGESAEPSALRAFDRWLDGRLGSVTSFVAAGVPPARRHAFVHDYLTVVWEAGAVPVVTWEPFAVDRHGGDDPVATIADGVATALLDGWASALADWLAGGSERELVVRPAHEMNGSWYPWSAGAGVDPRNYRRMWRRLHDAFTDAGASGDRVRWLWSVNAEPVDDLLAWYPGDEYVDRVGVDGYNFGDSQPWSEWRDPSTIFEPAFERLAGLNAPLTVPEFGCSSLRADGRRPDLKADWIADAFALFDTWNVRLAGWFDAAKETDWHVFTPAADADAGRFPATVTVDGQAYATYPTFRRAARHYLGE